MKEVVIPQRVKRDTGSNVKASKQAGVLSLRGVLSALAAHFPSLSPALGSQRFLHPPPPQGPQDPIPTVNWPRASPWVPRCQNCFPRLRGGMRSLPQSHGTEGEGLKRILEQEFSFPGPGFVYSAAHHQL